MLPNDEPDDFLGLRYERTPEDNRYRAKRLLGVAGRCDGRRAVMRYLELAAGSLLLPAFLFTFALILEAFQ